MRRSFQRSRRLDTDRPIILLSPWLTGLNEPLASSPPPPFPRSQTARTFRGASPRPTEPPELWTRWLGVPTGLSYRAAQRRRYNRHSQRAQERVFFLSGVPEKSLQCHVPLLPPILPFRHHCERAFAALLATTTILFKIVRRGSPGNDGRSFCCVCCVSFVCMVIVPIFVMSQ